MNAAPLFDVSVALSGREEITLRLDEGHAIPGAESELRPDAVKIEFQLPAVAGLLPACVVPIGRPEEKRYEHETPEFHRMATWLHRIGVDPEETLRRALQKISARQKKVGPLLPALLAAERERLRLGVKEREAANATHKKSLSRSLALLLPDKKIRRWALAPWNSTEGQEKVSRTKDSTKDAVSRSPVNTRRRAPHGRRTAPLDNGSGPLPRARHRHAEEVEDARSGPVLREGEREQGSLLARVAESIPGRANAPAHRRPRPRPGRVKKRPPP
jgi:hypothetical protein